MGIKFDGKNIKQGSRTIANFIDGKNLRDGSSRGGKVLGNVIDELTHVSMDELDISYLNPGEDNYKFLEDLANSKIPDISILNTESEVDRKYAEVIVKLSEDLLINT